MQVKRRSSTISHIDVAGNTATESNDLFGPSERLATSGTFNGFNGYVVAPDQRLISLILQPYGCGTLDLVPHYSFIPSPSTTARSAYPRPDRPSSR